MSDMGSQEDWDKYSEKKKKDQNFPRLKVESRVPTQSQWDPWVPFSQENTFSAQMSQYLGDQQSTEEALQPPASAFVWWL